MKEPTQNIKIGSLPVITSIVNVMFDQSWRQLTDFGALTIPRKVKTLDGKDVTKLIKRGDRIEIDLGYDGNNKREFIGYVTDLTVGFPVIINFEDSMFLLKKTTHNLSGESIQLKELIDQIVPSNIERKVINTELGGYNFANVSAAQILQTIQKEQGIYSYFKGEVLHVGFAYDFQFREIDYNFEENIREDNNRLNYRFADEVNYKVKAISILPDNTKITTQIGDIDGETRTLHFYNIKTESELQRIAQEEIKKLKFDGWRGHFRTFGYPRAQHGDQANIVDPDFPEYGKGAHFIDRVVTHSGTSGFYRDITPGRRAS